MSKLDLTDILTDRQLSQAQNSTSIGTTISTSTILCCRVLLLLLLFKCLIFTEIIVLKYLELFYTTQRSPGKIIIIIIILRIRYSSHYRITYSSWRLCHAKLTLVSRNQASSIFKFNDIVLNNHVMDLDKSYRIIVYNVSFIWATHSLSTC